MQDGRAIILFECKKTGSSLNTQNVSQLLRYFHAPDVKFGILTDGIVYRFFSDTEQSNLMDEKPFIEFDMLEFSEQDVRELKNFTKDDFNEDRMVDEARRLKYLAEIKTRLDSERTNPSSEFVRLIVRPVHTGSLTRKKRCSKTSNHWSGAPSMSTSVSLSRISSSPPSIRPTIA